MPRTLEQKNHRVNYSLIVGMENWYYRKNFQCISILDRIIRWPQAIFRMKQKQKGLLGF